MTDNTTTEPAPPAGLLRRLAAALYDGLVLLAILFMATLVLLPVIHGNAIAPHTWWYRGYLLLAGFLFFGWFWTHGGQTLGMRAWRIRIVQPDGTPPTWPQAALRFAGALLSWACLGAGWLWMLVDSKRMTWHDRLSGTRVVRIT